MSQAASQKTRLAQGIEDVASAVGQVGVQLRQKDRTQVADYAETAVGQLNQLSGYLRQQDVGQIVEDAQEMIRRRPALVLGGAFALGLLGARFLKSSSPTQPGNMRDSGMTGSMTGRYSTPRSSYSDPAYRTPSHDQPGYGNPMAGETPVGER